MSAMMRFACSSYCAVGLISEREIANIVDELEENGGQHIFLFRADCCVLR